jgi:hypothetical protein
VPRCRTAGSGDRRRGLREQAAVRGDHRVPHQLVVRGERADLQRVARIAHAAQVG